MRAFVGARAFVGRIVFLDHHFRSEAKNTKNTKSHMQVTPERGKEMPVRNKLVMGASKDIYSHVMHVPPRLGVHVRRLFLLMLRVDFGIGLSTSRSNTIYARCMSSASFAKGASRCRQNGLLIVIAVATAIHDKCSSSRRSPIPAQQLGIYAPARLRTHGYCVGILYLPWMCRHQCLICDKCSKL